MRRAAIAVAAVALVVAACSKAAPPPAPSPPDNIVAIAPPPTAKPPPRPAQLQHVTIKALGMDCEESCPMRVRYAIGENPAIYELGFDTSRESIFISYDQTLGTPKVVTKPFIDAIARAGFDPWLAKESWPDDAQPLVAVVPR